nr:DUF3387 domain-containing protein [Virgibacillus litoralis]
MRITVKCLLKKYGYPHDTANGDRHCRSTS